LGDYVRLLVKVIISPTLLIYKMNFKLLISASYKNIRVNTQKEKIKALILDRKNLKENTKECP